MKTHLLPLLLSTALLSSAPAWSADKKATHKEKSADKAPAAQHPAEKTVTGKLVSTEDNGMGRTYTVETADGKKVKADANPGMAPPKEAVKPGATVVMTYASVTETRVSEARLAKGPAFKKKPSSTARGTLVGYERGDMGDYITVDQGGKQENYLADFGVLSEEQVPALTGKQIELSLYPSTTVELRGIKPGP
jgi:hypothetical protein